MLFHKRGHFNYFYEFLVSVQAIQNLSGKNFHESRY